MHASDLPFLQKGHDLYEQFTRRVDELAPPAFSVLVVIDAAALQVPAAGAGQFFFASFTSPGLLGVDFCADRGNVVVTTRPDGQAHLAGMRQGDRVVAVDGKPAVRQGEGFGGFVAGLRARERPLVWTVQRGIACGYCGPRSAGMGALPGLVFLECRRGLPRRARHVVLAFLGEPVKAKASTTVGNVKAAIAESINIPEGMFKLFVNMPALTGGSEADVDPHPQSELQNDVSLGALGIVSDGQQLLMRCEPRQFDSDSDRKVLESLFRTTGGDKWVGGWRNKHGWLSKLDMNDWFGVTTNDQGRVVKLILIGQRLVGELPDDFWHLDCIQDLRLQDNSLTGKFPCLSQCSQLAVFSCRNNGFSGVLPAFTHCTELKYFRCSSNNFSSVLPEFLNCILLEWFDCSGNAFEGTLPSFAACTNLKDFRCASNRFVAPLPSFETCLALRNIETHPLSGAVISPPVPTLPTYPVPRLPLAVPPGFVDAEPPAPSAPSPSEPVLGVVVDAATVAAITAAAAADAADSAAAAAVAAAATAVVVAVAATKAANGAVVAAAAADVAAAAAAASVAAANGAAAATAAAAAAIAAASGAAVVIAAVAAAAAASVAAAAAAAAATAAASVSETEEPNCCVVCFNAPISVLLLPCKHCCMCEACTEQVEVCPICCAQIASKITGIYLVSQR
jgi:hypothetical protein